MPRAIVLSSKGLDSLLVIYLLKKLGITPIPVRFITPFFSWEYHFYPEKFEEELKELGLEEGYVVDITKEFLEILRNPEYGRGDYANPCIDCKILMLKKAKEIMEKIGADFIATGEVVGQRPMSQNKNSLELIEKKAGVSGILLRPLSAKLLSPTEPELKGLVDREKLYDIYGRRREVQFKLAREFGLKKIPSPSGGCLLTDPVIGSRVLKALKLKKDLNPVTAQLLTLGRHFLERDFWFVLGRRKEENEKICQIVEGKYPVFSLDVPSPVGVIVDGHSSNQSEAQLKELLIKYSKKARQTLETGKEVKLVKVI